VLGLTISWNCLKKGNMIRQPTRWSAGFLITKLTNSLLHFVTFVDFGFIYGYATIFPVPDKGV
jgi:hypothetical protein